MCDSPLSLSSVEWQERESLWLETHFQSHLAHERCAYLSVHCMLISTFDSKF